MQTGVYDFIVNNAALQNSTHVDKGGMALYDQDQLNDDQQPRASYGGSGRGRPAGRGPARRGGRGCSHR